jgi:formate dehydrogenase maturation protein FdhE
VNGKKWERRIARARELAETYSFARQILLFYCQLTNFQKGSYLQYSTVLRATRACATGVPPVNGHGQDAHGTSSEGAQSSLPAALDDVDLGHLLTRWRPFLSMIEAEAPSSLAEFARGLNASGPDAASSLLRAAWPATRPGAIESGHEADAPFGDAHRTSAQLPELSPFEHFCAHAFLQPYAEFLADHAELPALPVRLSTCPYCASPPLLGVLRPEGEGAKRSLVCSFCRTEWDYLRIACPACDERRDEKLCVYTAPNFEAVRVEACGSCRAYILTVDLTKNGLAVPEVDALAAIPLTLWADEKGYQKVARIVLAL